MGEVYLAIDARLQRKVVIKVLTSRLVEDPTSASRFAREARAASALNHPNIVTIHDIGRSEAGPYIVMEFIEGRSLRRAILELDLLAAVRVVAETARALAAAHEAGIVHRDVKPENIMLRVDGYVKVLDFGLARRIRDVDPENVSRVGDTEALSVTQIGSAVGTIHYMSPEQAAGDEVTGAADVFSLGIVFYELLTHSKPFAGRDRFEVLHRITSVDPVAPARVNPSIPPQVDALIRRMLSKRAADRPSAAEVAAALTATVAAPATALRTPNRLVGREVELDRLTREVEMAAAGSGRLVLVQGEAGLGKTALVETLLEQPAALRFRIARGRCSERLAGAEAYLPVLEALESLVAGSYGREFEELLRTKAPSWHKQLITLAGEEPAGPPGTADRAQREFVRLMEDAAREVPLLLFLEDLHWCDTATVDLLAYLATAMSGLRLLVVGTFRSSDLLRAKHPLIPVKLDWQARGLCHELTLDLLGPGDVARYIDLQFPGHALPPEFSKTIHARTDGSPLFMVDILRYLRDRGAIVEQGGWRLAGHFDEIVRDLPESVRSMIERKIGQLEEQDRRLLTIAAVQGAQFDSATVAEAAKLDPALVEERLEHADRVMALVGFSADGEFPDGTLTLKYAFRHALYQDTLYRQCRITQRTQLSRAVGESLAARYADDVDEISPALAFLFENARDPLRAARYYAGAARHSLSRSAPREAVQTGERGLSILAKVPDKPERDEVEAELRIAMSLPLTILGGFAAGPLEPLYLRLREIGERRGNSRALLVALTGLFSFYGSRAECAASHEIAEALARTTEALGDVDEMVNADRTRGFILAHLGRFRESEAAFDRSCSRFDPGRHQWQIMRYAFDPIAAAHSFGAWTRCAQGYADSGLARARTALERAREVQAVVGIALALSFSAMVHQFREEVEATLSFATALLEFATPLEMPLFVDHGSIWSGWALARLGDAEGVPRLRQALADQARIGNSIGRGHFLTLLADALWTAGDAAGALEAIEESLRFVEKSGNAYYEAETWRWRGVILAASDAAEAERSFRRALEVATAQGALQFRLRAQVSLGSFLAGYGRAPEVEAELRASLAEFPEPPVAADLAAANALLSRLG
jgi:tRNA A-37 threonylcarbamoyl transferase component Bud32/tetratricopeptide (TPR) repeat protein